MLAEYNLQALLSACKCSLSSCEKEPCMIRSKYNLRCYRKVHVRSESLCTLYCSFNNYIIKFSSRCLKLKGKSLSRVQLFATPWTAAHQASLSMGFSRQEYWSGVPLPLDNYSLKFPRLPGSSEGGKGRQTKSP